MNRLQTSLPTSTTRIALGALAVLIGCKLNASSIVTYAENPDAVNSTLSGTSVFDFNSLPLGLDTGVKWSGVGSFDRLYILKPDTYGGAADASHPKGTDYSVQGVGTSVRSTTLSLNSPSSYFGFWWSAGDPSNVLDFYNGNTLVQEFTTKSLMSVLPSEYFGNPRNRNLDSSEPFAFINFFGDSKTSWDRIVLTNSSGSGFESDNYTSRVTAWNPTKDGALPGNPVAIINGKTSTTVTSKSQLTGTAWADKAAPGAPAPPLSLLVAFGSISLLRGRKWLRRA